MFQTLWLYILSLGANLLYASSPLRSTVPPSSRCLETWNDSDNRKGRFVRPPDETLLLVGSMRGKFPVPLKELCLIIVTQNDMLIDLHQGRMNSGKKSSLMFIFQP